MADCRYVTEYPAMVRHRAETGAAARGRRRRLWIALPPIVVACAGAFAVSLPLGMMVAAVTGFVTFFLALPGGSSVPAGDLAGAEGEISVLRRLETLPDAFTIFNRVQLPDAQLPNGRRELDFVVAGPTGLWVIEVKNTPGLVHVRPDERRWPLVRRAGCGSRPAWNAIDNPLFQVRAQVDALRRWLMQQGSVSEPKAVVCLSHPEAGVHDGRAAAIPVVLRDELVGVIGVPDDGAQRAPGHALTALPALIRAPE
jgi:hypothetical protein